MNFKKIVILGCGYIGSELVEQLSKKYPLKVIHRPSKLGLGTAHIEGMKKAIKMLINGTVQGVFFRNFVKEEADKLDVKGFPTNSFAG